jgi:hypothetical protein
MPKPDKSRQLAILERRKTVAEQYLRGVTQWAIARKLGVSQPTIAADLKEIRADWLSSSLRDFDARKAEELAKVDRLESVAYDAWDKSCQNAETVHRTRETGRTTKEGAALPDRTRRSKISKGQAGDPRFLERVAWCIERRCKILGLDAATKHEYSGTIDLEERRSRLAALVNSLRERGTGGGDGTPLNGLGGGHN